MREENMKLMLQIVVAKKFYGTSVRYMRWTKVFVGLKRVQN